MKLLKSRKFACIVMIMAILLSSFFSLRSKPAVEIPDGGVKLDESLSTAYYERFIVDEANVLSQKTEKQLSLYNANWDMLEGRIMAVVTVKGCNNAEDAAWDWAEMLELGKNDAILLVDAKNRAYSVVCSGSFYDDMSAQPVSFVDMALYEGVQKEDFDTAAQNLFAQVHLFHEVYQSTHGGLRISVVILVVLFQSIGSSLAAKCDKRLKGKS